MAANVQVYTGFWTNWSSGRMAGATLTLGSQQSAYLVAFLALYVNYVGTDMWRLFSYFIFRAKASPPNYDSLRRDQLLILRNLSSSFDAMWELAKAAWKDRHYSKKALSRSILLIIAAALHYIAFTAAGILASRVTSAKSEVLLRSDTCGFWHFTGSHNWVDQPKKVVRFEANVNAGAMKASQFVAECYNSTSLANCNTYGRRLLDYNVSTHSHCPFDPSMCTHGTVIRLDTGFVDSLYDLGINSHPSERVQFRKVTECTPIETDGFSKTYTNQNLTDDIADSFTGLQSIDGSTFTALYYGKDLVLGIEPTFVFDNSTFDMDNYAWGARYTSSSVSAYPDHPELSNQFEPIPQLQYSKAQVLLLFLASGVFYTSPVLDPWFRAETEIPPNEPENIPFISYISRPQVSVLGCTTHTQVCSPVAKDGRLCLPLITTLRAQSLSSMSHLLGLSAVQKGVLGRFYNLLLSEIDGVFSTLGGDYLLASQDLDGNESPGLPENQWMLEVERLFSVLLAWYQISVTEYVTGAEIPKYNTNLRPPAPADRWMCDNQIVQRNDHASFSVLGLAIILVAGGLIILLNSFLSTLWPRTRSHSTLSKYRNSLWDSYELLELQPESLEDAKNLEDEKTPQLSISSSEDSVSSAIKAIGRIFGMTRGTESDDNRQSDDFHGRTPRIATIETQLHCNDFPPRELSDLLIAGRR